jgi:hypothetical protein
MMNDDTHSHCDLRVIDPTTSIEIEPMEQPGYYPGFSTLDQQKYWDEATRNVVLKRVHDVPPIRFFTKDEANTLEAICARILPQDDRVSTRRIPIVPQIDRKLYENIGDGYRYEDMPIDRDAFRMGIAAVDQIAREVHGKAFTELSPLNQEKILRGLHDAKPAGADDTWKKMPVHRFWMLLVTQTAEAYYAHPWAWDEIGFGGPAYPRAYMRLERGEPEPWEVHERRYPWMAPPWSESAQFEPIAGAEEQFAPPAQGGTH